MAEAVVDFLIWGKFLLFECKYGHHIDIEGFNPALCIFTTPWKALYRPVLFNRVNGSPQGEFNFCKDEWKKWGMKGEFYINFLWPFGFFFTQHMLAIINKMANLKRSNFSSEAVRNLSLQENCTLMILTTSMHISGIAFVRDSMFYSLEWRDLFCALHEVLYECYLVESQFSKVLFSIPRENQTHEHWLE